MAYRPTKRQIANAKRLGVTIKSSSRGSKKLDVFKKGVKVASIGAKGYADYDYYLKNTTKAFADSRRKNYKSRHQKYRNRVGTPSYYADKILW